jgi:hypothetical protein
MVRRAWALLALAAVLPACSEGLGEEAEAPAEAALEAPADLSHKSDLPDVSLRWTDRNGGAAGFRVEVNEGPFGVPPFLDAVYLPAGTTSLLYPAPAGKVLHFRVYAVSATRQSPPSGELVVEIPAVPDAPEHFTALALDRETVDLRWVIPGAYTGIQVQRSDDGGSSYSVVWGWSAPTPLALSTQGGVRLLGQAPGREYRYRLRTRNAEGWSRKAEARTWTQGTEPVPAYATGSDDGYRLSGAMSGNTLYVLHYDAGAQGVGVLQWNDGIVSGVQGLEGNGAGWHGTSIASDSAGALHAAYTEYVNDDLRYARRAPDGGWSFETIDPSALGRDPLVHVSPEGDRLRIVYRSVPAGSTGSIRLAARDRDGAWRVEDTVPSVPVGPFSAAYGPGATDPHLVYARGDAEELRHAWKEAGAWRDERVVEGGSPEANAAAFDASGRLHAAYYAKARGELRYAVRDAAWTVETVHRHTGGNLGGDCAIVVEEVTPRVVHIAYRNVADGDLWLARRAEGSPDWERRLVDSAGDVGWGVKLFVGSSRVLLLYRDATRADLKVIVSP